MLETKIQEMRNDKKEEITLNYQMREKQKLFNYIYTSRMADKIVATGSGLIGIVTGISTISEMQQPDQSMLGLYILGTAICAASTIYSCISAHNKNKKLNVIAKEMTEIRNHPEYKDIPILL